LGWVLRVSEEGGWGLGRLDLVGWVWALARDLFVGEDGAVI
jgi:hypothetical protein